MENKKKPKEISRREFIKEAGLVAGCAAVGSSVIFASGCGTSKYKCPYCDPSTEFDSNSDLKEHIWLKHAFNSQNTDAAGRLPIPMNLSIEVRQTHIPERWEGFVKRRNVLEEAGWFGVHEPYLVDWEESKWPIIREMTDLGWFPLQRILPEQDDTVPYAQRLQSIKDQKDQMEDLIGKPVLACMSGSKTWPDCFNLIDEAGYSIILLRASYGWYPYQHTAPWQLPGLNVCAIPRTPLHIWLPNGRELPNEPWKEIHEGREMCEYF